MAKMRIFYVLTFRSGFIVGSLNAIKFLSDPKQKILTHITVRGPYEHKLDEKKQKEIEKKINGKIVSINGVGAFFNENQSTVYLKCDSEDLMEIWDKPSYKGYNPHITLYDGKSREYAKKLLNVLSRNDISFEATADRILPYNSIKGQKDLFFGNTFNTTLIEKIATFRFRDDDIMRMDDEVKLKIIDDISDLLAKSEEHDPRAMIQTNESVVKKKQNRLLFDEEIKAKLN